MRIFLFFCLLLVNLTAFAAEDLVGILNRMQTVKSNFTQTLIDKSSRKNTQSKGVMYLARPNKFRWEETQPNEQIIIAKENKLWLYQPDLEQVTIRSLTKEAGEAPALFLSHATADLNNSFIVTSTSQNNSLWFTLTPKNRNSMFEYIKLHIQDNKIIEMNLQDHLGHQTLVKFSNIIINKPLSDKLFSLTIPKNADVIDETRK